MRKFLVLGGMAVLLLGTAPALADEWAVVKLRGTVQQLIDGAWTPVARGDKIADDRPVRTLGDGHADLQRGAEIVTLGADTQVVIHDKADVRYTTVQQDFGTVEVEAQVENVQHFAVDTPFLAAVVKGTRFTVTSGKTGSSVSVQRGHVQVEDFHNHTRTLLSVGQMATVDRVKTQGQIAVGGSGELPPVTGANGKPVSFVAGKSGVTVTVGGGLLNAGIGNKSGVTVGVGQNSDIASAGIGGNGGLVDGGGSSGGSGGLLNVNVGKLHIGL